MILNDRMSAVRGALAVLLGMVLISGCSLQTHAQKKEQAEQRWSNVRARVKFQLARQQYEQGQIEPALASVSEAIALDGNNTEQFLLLAHCCLEQGKPASAREAADRAAACSPNAPEVAYAYGLLAEAEEDHAKALERYRKARETDPRAMDYLVAEAESLVALGRAEEATVLVTENLGKFDSRGTLEMLLAQIAMLTGDKERALHHLRSAAQAGDNALITEEYGRMLAEAGRHEQAAAVLMPFVAERGAEAPASAVMSLSTSLMATGRTREALPRLQELVRRRPDDPRAWALLARAAMDLEDWRAAGRCANELERLSPEGSLAHVVRGYVSWMEDDLVTARAELERALQLDAKDPLAQDLMGRVREKSGEAADIDRSAPPDANPSLKGPVAESRLPRVRLGPDMRVSPGS